MFFVNSLTGGGAEKVLQTLLNGWEGRGWDISVYCLKKEDVPPGYPRSIAFHFLLDSLRKGDGFWTRLKVKAGNKLKLLVYRHCPPPVFYRMFVRGTYDVEAAFIEGYATRIASGSPNPDSRKLAWVHIDLAANHWTLPAYRNAEEEKRAYRQFDTVVSVSRDVRESVVALAGPLRDARVLYNPIDAQAIRENPRNSCRSVRRERCFSAPPAVLSARRDSTAWRKRAVIWCRRDSPSISGFWEKDRRAGS